MGQEAKTAPIYLRLNKLAKYVHCCITLITEDVVLKKTTSSSNEDWVLRDFSNSKQETLLQAFICVSLIRLFYLPIPLHTVLSRSSTSKKFKNISQLLLIYSVTCQSSITVIAFPCILYYNSVKF